jgi:hypothetical protein
MIRPYPGRERSETGEYARELMTDVDAGQVTCGNRPGQTTVDILQISADALHWQDSRTTMPA